jgi:hypothetical protein
VKRPGNIVLVVETNAFLRDSGATWRFAEREWMSRRIFQRIFYALSCEAAL